MRSALPVTGKCYWCGSPTEHRFCGRSCTDKYHVYKSRGKDIPSNARPADTDKRLYTASKLTWAQIMRNIDRIVERDLMSRLAPKG
jgi:hypothetical protein